MQNPQNRRVSKCRGDDSLLSSCLDGTRALFQRRRLRASLVQAGADCVSKGFVFVLGDAARCTDGSVRKEREVFVEGGGFAPGYTGGGQQC
jgi:hypothetical protein